MNRHGALRGLLVAGAIAGLGGARGLAVPASDAEKGSIRDSYAVVAVENGAGAAPTGAWRAVNRAHRLVIDLGPDGLLVRPEGESGASPTWEWSLALDARSGLSEGERPAGASVTEGGNRIVFDRGAWAQEFVNDAQGVRHRLVLHAPPRTAADAGSRVGELEFAMRGNLTRKPSTDGRSLTLLLGGEPVLEYRDLKAADALGRSVPVRLELAQSSDGPPSRLRVLASVSKAVYPISIAARLVSAKPGGAGTPAGELAPLAAPSNDECPGAQLIPPSGPFPYTTSTVQNISDATTTGDPPLPSCQSDVSRSIWYKFTPTLTADYTISTCADAPTGTTVDDTVVAIYENSGGDTCAGSFVELPSASPYQGCDDDSCVSEDFQSVVTTELDAGVTYFIVVWSYGTDPPAGGNTAVQLRIGQQNPVPPPPANDACAGRESIPAAGPFPYLTSTLADVTGATTTGDPPAPACATLESRSVWYEFTPAASADYTFSSCADAPTSTTLDDTLIAIYTSSTSSCDGSFTQAADACDESGCTVESGQATVTAALDSGVRYFVVVWQGGTARPAAGNTALQLRVTKSIPPLPPANDLCASAETIADGPYPILTSPTPDVTSATTSDDPAEAPSCGGTSRSRSVWYQFTPSQSAAYTISTCSGDGTGTTLKDTIVAVYTSTSATCGGTLSQVAGGCDDDGCTAGEAQSVVTATLAGGVKHFIVVWKKGGSLPTPGQTAVQVKVSRGAAAPPNDTCSGASVVPDGPYPVLSAITADVTGASTAGDPSSVSCQSNRSRGIWYRFSPSTSGYYTLSTCADAPTATTVDDTVLSVYTSGAGCSGPFTEVPTTNCGDGCDEDSCAVESNQAVVTGYLNGGTTYYILVWQYGVAAPTAGNTAVQLSIGRASLPAAPASDNCASAELLPADGPFPYASALLPDVSGATCAGDPPAPSCEPATSRSVWYTITPSTAGRFTFSTCADAPISTTADDTVIGVYTSSGGCAGPFASLTCDDDGCASEALQSVVESVPLAAGTTYYVVVWQFGTEAPAAGQAALQLRVDADFTPPNDACAAATSLTLDVPRSGTTVAANDDYRLSGSGCFTGLAETPTIAPGRDATFAFVAPSDGAYSFKVSGYAVAAPNDVALYVAGACETGPTPVTLASCLAASNRNTGGSSEEVVCLPMTAGQRVFAFVDDATSGNPGSAFTIEVGRCTREVEPNDTTASAGVPACPVEGATDSAGDVDFYALGTPPGLSRVFAMADGVAASATDFDLRVTTAADTLEYDDLNNDAPFGNQAPNVGGTKLQGTASFLRVNYKSSTTVTEPYRLYEVTQPPSASAQAEAEPNDTLATANVGDYVYGSLTGPAPSTDLDVYRLVASVGDVLFVGLDGDPGYDNTPLDGKLEILDATGTVVASANDNGRTSSLRAPVSGLSATSPVAPAESLTYRVPASGTYYVRVRVGTTGATGGSGDYLLSIAPACLPADADGDGVPNATDCARSDGGARSLPSPVAALTLSLDRPTGSVTLAWTSQDGVAGSGTSYDVARGTIAALRAGGFPGGAACAANDVPDTPYVEAAGACAAGPGDGCWYLVRAQNACGTATYREPGGVAHPLDGASSPCP